MLSSMKPKVQGVASGVVCAAPKPFSFLKIRSAVAGGGGARRALAALGTNNAKLNMSMAKTHLANVQEGFAKKWNFNPVKEVPLAEPGRYQWTPLSSVSSKDITSPASEVIAKEDTPPAIEGIHTSVTHKDIPKDTDNLKASQDAEDSKCTVTNSTSDQENIENEVKIDNKFKQVISPNTETIAVPMKNVTPNSQNCITDFFRHQKRKSGYLQDTCIPCPDTPPKKKARAIH